MFFKNAKKKLMAKRQIFQLIKRKSKSPMSCPQPSDAKWEKMHASMNHEGRNGPINKNLGKDSKNELQALQNQGGNKIVSEKELDIKIYNEKTKKNDQFDEEPISKSPSKIINKLSGSSIIIVYENSLGTKTSSRTSQLEVKGSGSSVRILSNLVNHRHCSGDVSCTGLNLTSSSSSKSLDAEINNNLQSSPKNHEKKIVIQCFRSKKDKDKESRHERKKQKTRMKLIPPEELSEPKCVKIVKKAVTSDADLTQDLSNMMTGGRLMQTLSSFLGADQSNYVEIIQRVNGLKQHKILLFKRQIEKCKKCKEEEFCGTVNLKPESNIVRLTVKRTDKNTKRTTEDSSQKSTDFNPSHLSEKNYLTGDANESKTNGRKPIQLKNLIYRASDINVLLASTLNELTGGLNAQSNYTKSERHESSNNNASAEIVGGISDIKESVHDICCEKSIVRNSESDSKVSVHSHESILNSHDKKPKENTKLCERDSSVNVVWSSKPANDQIFKRSSHSSEENMFTGTKNGLNERVVFGELQQNLSKGDSLAEEILDTVPSPKILKCPKSASGTDKNRSTKKSEDVLTVSLLSAGNGSFPGLEAPEIFVTNHVHLPSLQDDTTFLQFFDKQGLPKMGENNFFSDPLMQSMKTGYYNLKKSYAASITLQKLASVESFQQVAASPKHSRVLTSIRSKMDVKKEIVSVTTSEESMVSSGQSLKKTSRLIDVEKHSYVEKNNDYLKLDFMNFNFNKQLDTLIAPTSKCFKHGKQQKERLGSVEDVKRKKKATFWGRKFIHLSAPPCRMKKSNHRHCHKLV